MNQEFGLKELYDVRLKATSNIEINGKTFEKGETVAAFDKIFIANFNEITKNVTAHGGFHDRPRVWWTISNEVDINFSQGIFSKVQLALLTNARVVSKQQVIITIDERENVQSDEEGVVELQHTPVKYLYVYDARTGERVNYTPVDSKSFKVESPLEDLIVDYAWDCDSGYTQLKVGDKLEGTFVLIGRTKVKDDITGKVHTGIITIPQLKLTSDLSIQLGKTTTPVVGELNAVAYPMGSRENSTIMTIDFLEEEIDSDI